MIYAFVHPVCVYISMNNFKNQQIRSISGNVVNEFHENVLPPMMEQPTSPKTTDSSSLLPAKSSKNSRRQKWSHFVGWTKKKCFRNRKKSNHIDSLAKNLIFTFDIRFLKFVFHQHECILICKQQQKRKNSINETIAFVDNKKIVIYDWLECFFLENQTRRMNDFLQQHILLVIASRARLIFLIR